MMMGIYSGYHTQQGDFDPEEPMDEPIDPQCKYPWITHRHQLDGPTGNAYVIMGAVAETMREADIPETEIRECMKEATSGNYENLLATMRSWIDFRTEHDE